jgi:hypothetical protein
MGKEQDCSSRFDGDASADLIEEASNLGSIVLVPIEEIGGGV